MNEKAIKGANQAVREVLLNSDKPLVAYQILDRLKDKGINAPPTVYRALDKLVKLGMAHRIVSNHSYVSCHHAHNHNECVIFTLCQECGDASEMVDASLNLMLENIKKTTGFTVQDQIVEITGLCHSCKPQEAVV